MKNVIQLAKKRDANTEIENQASQWLIKFDQRKPHKDDFIAFMKWYRSNPRHQEVYDALAETWDMSIVAKNEVPTTQHASRRSRFTAIAASVLLLFAATFWILDAPVLEQRDFATQQLQRSTTELSDGSLVDLDSASMLSTDFDATARDLYLESGQAYFDVSHDKSRPFIVNTPYGSVRAVGTAFSVDIHNGHLQVLVTEGRVAVDGQQTEQAKVLLDAGHEVRIINSNTEINTVSTAEQQQRLAWRKGRLEYSGQPLSKVMQDVSRYQKIDVIFDQPELERIAIGGSFSADNMDGLLESLQQGFAIAHRYDAQGRLVLSNVN